MRARIQQGSILNGPKYLQDVNSVIIYDDFNQPIACLIKDPAGIRVSYIGQPGFAEELRSTFKIELDPNITVEEIKPDF